MKFWCREKGSKKWYQVEDQSWTSDDYRLAADDFVYNQRTKTPVIVEVKNHTSSSKPKQIQVE